MNHPRRTSPIFFICIALFAILAMPAAAQCQPEFGAHLDTEEPQGDMTNLQFRVEIRSDGDCADIVYDLVIELQAPNGHAQLVRKMRSIRLRNTEESAAIRHQVRTGTRVVGQEVKLVSCEVCGSP